jgi:hypothetical protein
MNLRIIPASLLLAGALAAPALAEEVIVYSPPTTTYYYTAPTTTYYYSTPSLTEIYTPTYRPTVIEVDERVVVTAPSLTQDEAITRDVVDTLVADSRLGGRIGVETRNNTVELSGRVTTPGQARIAERDARSVPGVREVQSQLRSSVGGSY